MLGCFFLRTTSVCGCSSTLGGSRLLPTDRSLTIVKRDGLTRGVDSSCATGARVSSGVWFSMLAGACVGRGEGAGLLTAGEGAASGIFSGTSWGETSDAGEWDSTSATGLSLTTGVSATCGWLEGSTGGGGGILVGGMRILLDETALVSASDTSL